LARIEKYGQNRRAVWLGDQRDDWPDFHSCPEYLSDKIVSNKTLSNQKRNRGTDVYELRSGYWGKVDRRLDGKSTVQFWDKVLTAGAGP